MVVHSHKISALSTLRQYVNETICERCELKVGAFPMTERILVRGGRPCGIYFCVHGPRSTKLCAIWETDRNQILFYGSRGERLQRTLLSESPLLDLAELREQVAAS